MVTSVDARTGTRIEQLRRLALERPDDDAALLVYADALMESGDPLGAFIEEQRRDPSIPVPESIRKRLAGPIQNVARLGIRRGLLREVHLNQIAPKVYSSLTGHSAWESVEAVRFTPSGRMPLLPTRQVVALLSDLVCRNVRRVSGITFEILEVLTAVPLSYESVSVEHGMFTAELEAAPKLSVRRLAFDLSWAFFNPEGLRLWAANEGKHLMNSVVEFRVTGREFVELELMSDLPPRLELLAGTRSEAVRREGQWHFTLEPMRSGDGNYGRMLAQAEAVLERYARRFASITLRVPNIGAAATQRFIDRAGGVPMTVEPVAE